MRIVWVIAMLAVGVGAATASPALTPTAALAKVRQAYAKADHLKAGFRQTVTSQASGTSGTTTSQGSVYVTKTGLVRWDYFEIKRRRVATSRTAIFDGQTFWWIDHDTRQITRGSAQSRALQAAVSFLTRGLALASQFDVALTASGTVLELTPKQPTAYAKLSFVVDPSSWRVHESVVTEHNGDTSSFKLYSPDVTSPVKSGWFAVRPASMPGYTLVGAAPQPQAPATGSGSASPGAP